MGEAAVNLCTHTLAPNLPEDDIVVEMLWEAHASVIVLLTSPVLDSASLEGTRLLLYLSHASQLTIVNQELLHTSPWRAEQFSVVQTTG